MNKVDIIVDIIIFDIINKIIHGCLGMESLVSCLTVKLTCSLHSPVRYRVEHEKRNSVASHTHVLFSVYHNRGVSLANWFINCLDDLPLEELR